jgi:hypothetical protein
MIGMHVVLSSNEVCLYLASEDDEAGTAHAWVLKLEPHTRVRKRQVPLTKSKKRKAKAPSSAHEEWEDSVHPVNKLPWYKRRPVDEIKLVRADHILMRVRVAPAFTYDENGVIGNDGYLLSHGMYNYDLRGKNEKVFVVNCV